MGEDLGDRLFLRTVPMFSQSICFNAHYCYSKITIGTTLEIFVYSIGRFIETLKMCIEIDMLISILDQESDEKFKSKWLKLYTFLGMDLKFIA